jgi:hypothetical protein
MCFSATASFAAAGVTTVAGGVAVRATRRPAQLLLAVIPLFFAFHQAAEGFLWRALTQPEHAGWIRPAMFSFLAVAEVVWPFWVPLAIWAQEDDPRRKRILAAVLVLGCALALARAYGLYAWPVSASIVGRHIQYQLSAPYLVRPIGDVCYLLVTVGPPLLSSNRLIRVLGVVVLASFVLAELVFSQTAFSVWCFFAAILSAFIVAALKRRAVPQASESFAA